MESVESHVCSFVLLRIPEGASRVFWLGARTSSEFHMETFWLDAHVFIKPILSM